jgi:hypothetical protein
MNSQESSLPSSSSPTGTSTIWVDPDGTLHEACRLLFFVGREFLGESAFDPGNAPEMDYLRSGIACFCTHCGEVWGRVVLVDSHARQGQFEVVEIPCERHSGEWETPGSFLGGRYQEGLLKYLPPKVVVREFEIYLRKGLE